MLHFSTSESGWVRRGYADSRWRCQGLSCVRHGLRPRSKNLYM
jgi:hypothetical protein